MQGLTREQLHKDRYWGGMQRLGGTLSHMLKEVPLSGLDLSQVTLPLVAASPTQPSPCKPKHAMSEPPCFIHL